MKRFLTIAAACCLSQLAHAETPSAVAENSALIPVPKLESDSYDWDARHAKILELQKSFQPDVVLIGDSITHFWGGEPSTPNVPPKAPNAWSATFGTKKVLNLGFGWDRTQNVLWRLQHGEFDGLKPSTVVVLIGTNNFSQGNARVNTPSEICDAIHEILKTIYQKSRCQNIILMGVLPRGFSPQDPNRAKIIELNALLAKKFVTFPMVKFVNLYDKFLEKDGSISKSIMGDGLHPTEQGYTIWGDAIKPLLR